jgi:hypothetical protein
MAFLLKKKSIESADKLKRLHAKNTQKVIITTLITDILMENQSDCAVRRHPAASS